VGKNPIGDKIAGWKIAPVPIGFRVPVEFVKNRPKFTIYVAKICFTCFHTKFEAMEEELKSGAATTQLTIIQSTFVQTFLANIIVDGNKTSTGLKKVHLNACAKALNDYFKINRTHDQIGNNLKTLKKYTRINYLRKLSATLWDEDQFIITLDCEHYTNHFEVKYVVALIHLIISISVVLYVLIMLLIVKMQEIRVMMSS
jgi:hypothetical protein